MDIKECVASKNQSIKQTEDKQEDKQSTSILALFKDLKQNEVKTLVIGGGRKLSVWNLNFSIDHKLGANGFILNDDLQEKHSGDPIQPGKTQLKDGGFSSGIQRFRTRHEPLTETQSILTGTDQSLETLKTLLPGNHIVDEGEASLDVEQVTRMINCACRRCFETQFAKCFIEKFFQASNVENIDRIVLLGEKFKHFAKEMMVPKTVRIYEDATKGNFQNILQKDERGYPQQAFTAAVQFQAQISRNKALYEIINISQESKDIMVSLYNLRYLLVTLRNDIKATDKLPKNFWTPFTDIIEKAGKGRAELDVPDGSAMKVIQSHTSGIFRSHDPVPVDLRAPHNIDYSAINYSLAIAAGYSRGPDRVEPWLQPGNSTSNLFLENLSANKTGSFVNGVSSTILSLIGVLLAAQDISNRYEHLEDEQNIDLYTAAQEILAKFTPEELKLFFQLQACFFIFVDGGHSMDEISFALNHQDTKELFIKYFGKKPEYHHIIDDFFMDEEVLIKAFQATRPFAQNLLAKDKVHDEVERRYLSKNVIQSMEYQ